VLDLRGGGRRLAPPGRLDQVRVVVGQLERRGALSRDVLQLGERHADAQEQAEDATAQPQRRRHAPRQGLPQSLVEARQTLRHDLRPERRRRVERLGEVLRAREADQPGAVDVDHVERHRHPGRAARLGDELVGDQVRGDLVEDVRDLERHRPCTAQAPGRLIGQRRHERRRLAHTTAGLLERRGQVLARREVAIQRRAADVRRRRDLGHARAAILDQRAGRAEDALATGLGVGAQLGGRPAFALWLLRSPLHAVTLSADPNVGSKSDKRPDAVSRLPPTGLGKPTLAE
jgi:hypothetical protein